jgi:hypothetical protein
MSHQRNPDFEGITVGSWQLNHPFGNYNHSDTPNCHLDDRGDHMMLIADKDLAPGDELTGDYSKTVQFEQPMPWFESKSILPTFKQYFLLEQEERPNYKKTQADAMRKVVSQEWMHELINVLGFNVNRDMSIPMEKMVYSKGSIDVTFYFGALGGTHVEAVQVTGVKREDQETLKMPGMFHGLDKEDLMRHIRTLVGALGGGAEMSFAESG